jgi:hypothetical protein
MDTGPVTIRASCPWCHQLNVIAAPRVHCPNCGHRADKARLYCDCDRCLLLRLRRKQGPRMGRDFYRRGGAD